MRVVHNWEHVRFHSSGLLPKSLLGGLTCDSERYSQLAPGVPGTSGGVHGAGELLLGIPELRHRRLKGLQGAPVAPVDEAAAGDALAHGGAPGVAAATQRHRPVGDHGAMLAVGTQDWVVGVAAGGVSVNVA